ncbi:MAG: hypothetical protein OES57_18735 [Acidimicrobiia bacterium]|nr:hypothetical protein [Acidimicrobiia bacterium]
MRSIAELNDATEAMAVLAKVDWVAEPGDVCGDALQQLSALRSILDAVEAAATGAFDQRRIQVAQRMVRPPHPPTRSRSRPPPTAVP